MIDPPTSAGGRDAVLLRAREGLWRAVRSRDEHAAAAAVFAALDDGAGAEDVLLEVIAPVQHKVGTEWAADRLTVAQEHAATAIQDRIITAMADRVPVTRPRGGRGTVAVACVDGDWHVLPTRILAEVLRHRGYPVDFLGAQVPTSRLIAHLHRTAPAALALSSSLPTHLPGAHTAISAAQAAGVPVLAGGAAFGADGRYARLLGADGWAPDARGATAVLDGGAGRRASPPARRCRPADRGGSAAPRRPGVHAGLPEQTATGAEHHGRARGTGARDAHVHRGPAGAHRRGRAPRRGLPGHGPVHR
ncbi:cobalamin-binding protein [Streptomyces xiamenensis]|uniref:Cobalamin-binding protein n=1 Tax=Streptomyces xiamenensis TaxID=408015 RepID=A0A0F7G023_9ACTN|nr:cobalamin-dependent protein [Streptomyces xiamenensis]AKG45928.1 cobalamin-binding protein [Streptomyces xiamenensis]